MKRPGEGAYMRTIIVNNSLNPELFDVLQDARIDGIRYQGCYISEYQVFTKGEDTYGLFTLIEIDDEPSNYAA